jgi:hypothetical protein
MDVNNIPPGAILVLITVFSIAGARTQDIAIFRNRETLEKSAMDAFTEDGPNFNFFELFTFSTERRIQTRE